MWFLLFEESECAPLIEWNNEQKKKNDETL